MKTKKGTPMNNKRKFFAKKRSDKRGIHIKGKWKAVDLDPSLFSDEGMDGLVCFEELTDYSLVDSENLAANLQKKEKQACKRKSSETEKNDGKRVIEGDGDQETTHASDKPAKKKNKKGNVSKDAKPDNISVDADGDEQVLLSKNDGKLVVEGAGDQETTNASGKPPKKKNKKGSVSKDAKPVTISVDADGDEQVLLSKNDEKLVIEGAGDQETTNASGKPAKKKNKKGNVSKDAKPVTISVDADGDEQALLSKDKAEDGASHEESHGGADSKIDAQSEVDTKIDKKKKKKKKTKQTATGTKPETVPESTVEVDVNVLAKEQPPKDKLKKLPKNQGKNWTNAALSGAGNQCVDVSAWKDLFVPAPVLKALCYLGFSSPTPIQALALPSAIRDRMDIVGAAETGSGKTLSFAIPMIHTILEWRKGAPEQDDADAPTSDLQTESPVIPDAKMGDDASSVAEVTEEDDNEDLAGQDEDVNEDLAGQDEDDTEGDLTDDEVESDDEKMGCVKVINDVEFDFETTAEEANASESRHQPLLGLVLTPTRELAVQVKHHIDAVAQFTDIKTAIIVGGMSQQKQARMLKRKPEIVIATPGRLWELIREGHPHLLSLRHLKCLVIDEADRMIERGHFAELENILEMLSTTYFNPKRQMFVFSATLTMAASIPTRLLQKKKRLDRRSKLEILMQRVGIKAKPKVIDLTRKEATVETLTETQIHCVKDDKDFFLYYFLLQYPGRTMVFANSIDCIKRLNCLLVILDCTPLPLHANMHQKQRLKNLERFAERESCVLLTTDVAARGLDIPNVQHVIHYQVPRTSETYVHRSGRTARATKEGLSLLLISPDDMLNFKKIYRSLGKDEEEVSMFPVQTKCMDAIKERVNLARQIEKIEFHNSKEKSHNSWFKQAAEALEVDLDDDVLMGRDRDEDADRQQQKMVKGMKRHLKYLISQPVFKHDIRTKYPTQMGKLSLPVMPRAGVESAITSVSKQPKKQRQKKTQQQH